ncbi:MAG: hypothetical protein COY40_02450 [Alphaproteobacteria bacterium CG_4_10_14_0_8_um_filter_53_9]|nr:MAG: hypothetical protein COY40_02450 [Alphaproteobacteria bacterium CG_4_10_14_0_8_um_filter_53_9]
MADTAIDTVDYTNMTLFDLMERVSELDPSATVALEARMAPGSPKHISAKSLARGAQGGNVDDMLSLALCCHRGLLGVTANLDTAISWYQNAADRGNSRAQFCLAIFSLFEAGTPEEDERAISLIRESAAQDYYQAHFFLGLGFLQGLFGLPKKPRRALKHFFVTLKLRPDFRAIFEDKMTALYLDEKARLPS